MRVTAGHNIATSDDNAGEATSVGDQATSVAALHRRADSSRDKSDESAGSFGVGGVTAGGRGRGRGRGCASDDNATFVAASDNIASSDDNAGEQRASG